MAIYQSIEVNSEEHAFSVFKISFVHIDRNLNWFVIFAIYFMHLVIK